MSILRYDLISLSLIFFHFFLSTSVSHQLQPAIFISSTYIFFLKMACVYNSSEETSSLLINRCLVHISDPLFILLPGKNHRHTVSNIPFCKTKWTVKHTKWIMRKLAHIYRGFCSDLRVCDVPVKLAVCITENACHKRQHLQIGV